MYFERVIHLLLLTPLYFGLARLQSKPMTLRVVTQLLLLLSPPSFVLLKQIQHCALNSFHVLHSISNSRIPAIQGRSRDISPSQSSKSIPYYGTFPSSLLLFLSPCTYSIPHPPAFLGDLFTLLERSSISLPQIHIPTRLRIVSFILFLSPSCTHQSESQDPRPRVRHERTYKTV